jgi:ATP-binding cassette, subfamily C (CFTR/MRP), member 4
MHGAIVFKNVFLRYRDGLDYVLRGLNFEVKPGEKIGCVGRTGAGKSSLIQALFKMVKIDKEIKDSGIFIDGLNIDDIGLNTLRSNISIIPQSPFVFTGTIRRNLDPFEAFSEEEILNVLEEVELLVYVKSLSNGNFLILIKFSILYFV